MVAVKYKKIGCLKYYYETTYLFRVYFQKSNSDILFHIPFRSSTIVFASKTTINDGKVILGRIFEKVSFATVISNQIIDFVSCDFHIISDITVDNFYRSIVSADSLTFSQSTTKDTVGDSYSL